MININEILRCFPVKLVHKLDEYFTLKNFNLKNLEEIRIRVNRPVLLKIGQAEELIEYTINADEILEILQHICDNSIYSYQNQIANGYITIKGGHRVGIAGNAVIKDGKVINISYISSLNFRIAKQVIGASDKILKHVLDVENNTVYNTLIVSPPGVGKTTLIRDLIRRISNGIDQINFKGINVGVADERGEIAAMYRGIPQNDVGIRTDIIDNVPKYIGMTMLIRSMAPKVIVADEIGSKEDVKAIRIAMCSGVKGIFTAHGSSLEDIKLNPNIKELIENNCFEKIIFLSDKKAKGEIERIY
jgi:stage III sporulation protein AA